MRRLTTTGVIAFIGATACVAIVTRAAADTTCQLTDRVTGKCLITVEVPQPDENSDGPKDTGAGHACYWDPKKQHLSRPAAGPVPCSTEFGYWSNHYNCYFKRLSPQPPATDLAWKGHQPGDGAIYDCYQPQTDFSAYMWLQNPPLGADAGPSPREVAQLAISQMELRAVDIGITPKPGAGSVGVVGMPVWMWAANPDSHTVGPITSSASGGGITVSATARLHEVTWSMGDGTTVQCTGRGTPYKTSYGMKESPDCGHTYQRSSSRTPAGTYTVTATSGWVVQWNGAGQSGTIRLNGLQRSAEISIGEAQVLVR